MVMITALAIGQKVRQQDGIADVYQDTDQRCEQQDGASTSEGDADPWPSDRSHPFHDGAQSERQQLSESDLSADRRRINDPVGAQYPIADGHPQRQRWNGQNGQGDLEGGCEAGMATGRQRSS